MNYRIVFYILGKVIIFLGLFLLLPFAVALIYQEKSGIYFLITAIISLVVGLLLSYKKPKDKRFYAREGFVVVALSWIVMSIIGACPFFFSGEIPSMVDAVFEIASGFTTTGASILTRVEDLSQCMLFWRSFSHWIGGMGVIVFIMAIIPPKSYAFILPNLVQIMRLFQKENRPHGSIFILPYIWHRYSFQKFRGLPLSHQDVLRPHWVSARSIYFYPF